jgi:hypothetical protein
MTAVIAMFTNDQWLAIVKGVGFLIFWWITLSPVRKLWTSPRHIHHHTDARRAKDN